MMDAVPHGTDNGYVHHGCRCPDCRAANTERCLAARDRRYGQMLRGEVAPRHGTISTYSNYGCRCERCRTANTEYYREYWSRRRLREGKL